MTQREPGHLERIVEGIDHADDAIAMFELDGTFIYCNAAWKVLHRLDPEADYTGQKDSVIDMPELRPGIEELKSNIGPGFKYVTRQTLETDGTEKTFTISVNYISGREKPVVLVMFRDVTDLENARCDLKQCHDRLEEIIEVRTAELEETNMMLIEQIRERKEAEKSLREKEEHVRNLFKALPIATFTFLRQGDSFVFKDYNDAAVEMTRGHVTDDVGKRADVMLKDRPGILEDLEKCFSEKKSFEYEREYYDDVIGERWDLSVSYVFVPPDTVMVHTENITARVNAEKELKEHHDHLQELVGERTAELEEVNRLLREEIAQREKTQEALVESEQKYRTISGMTSDYTFVAALLPDGTLRREWMAGAFEKITGYSRKGLDGKLDEFSIVHPEDRSRLMGILPRLKEQAPVESIEFRMISKSGRDVWVEAMAKPLPPSGEGYPRGMIAVKDINDRKTAEVELARRNRELAVVNRIREIFDSGSRDREIMDMILEALLDNSEALSAGVCNVDRDTGSLEIIAARNISGNFIDEFGKSPLLTETASRIIDDNMVLILQEDSGPTTKRTKVMRKYGVYQTIAFPVKTRGGETAIFMIGYGKDRKLGQEKMRFFDIVRNQVRLQFERRVLLADREWHERELRDLTVSLIGLLEKERNMIALKLHDELGQELVAVNAEILFLENQIESCENKPGDTLAKIKEQLKKLTRNVREMSYSIHPAVLEDLGLRPALRSYIKRFIESSDLHVDLVTTGFDGKLIGSESLAMYRIAQEALTNVVKHAEARNVTVRIIRGYPDLILTIEDDGKGFTPDGEEFRGKGLGIINMRERVEGMGGRFRIYSVPGKGTRIRAAIPMEGQDDE
jgi:PAS domain S-box-containing protein